MDFSKNPNLIAPQIYTHTREEEEEERKLLLEKTKLILLASPSNTTNQNPFNYRNLQNEQVTQKPKISTKKNPNLIIKKYQEISNSSITNQEQKIQLWRKE